MTLRSEIRGILTGVSLVAAVVLVAISMPPRIPGQELLHSLRFHIAIACLVLPLLLLINGAWIRASLFGALVALSLGQGALIVRAQQATRAPLPGEDAPAFTLMSFNVLSSNRSGRELADYVIASAPDIAVIMEAPGIARYLPDLLQTFPYKLGCDGRATCDLMVLSRTPFTSGEVRPLYPLNRERLILGVTEIAGRSVNIVGVHLSKPYFDETAAIELDSVEKALVSIDGPMVLAGDLNAAAWSRSVARFVEQSGLEPPPSYPATWPVRAGAFGVPIDNVFSRNGAVIESISATPSSFGSNHYGLIAKVRLAE